MNIVEAKKVIQKKLSDVKFNTIINVENMFLISIDGANHNSIGIKVDNNISIWGYEEDIVSPLEINNVNITCLKAKEYMQNGYSISLFDSDSNYIGGSNFLLSKTIPKNEAETLCKQLIKSQEFDCEKARFSNFFGDIVYDYNIETFEHLNN